MKKFHFGHGIALTLILFIAFLVIALFKSIQMDHTLVVDDYYAKDLVYQKTYEKIENAIKFEKDFEVHWDGDKKQYAIQFSDMSLKKGIIKFYRPSNSALDFEIGFETEQETIIDRFIEPGKWTVIAEWEESNMVFQKSKKITIGV